MASPWTNRYRVIVASDVSARDGLGWEFYTSDGTLAWEVFREDSGPFPVFSATRGAGRLPTRDDLLAMTTAAVVDLLAAAGLADDQGWITGNIAAALAWASEEVTSWEGEEWAVESDAPLERASPVEGRTPFAWLRARCHAGSREVGVYQDDAVFGLDFTERWTRHAALPSHDEGSLRSRRGIPLARGHVRSVEVVLDTTVDAGRAPGLVTEVLLHAERGALLLIAAEAYGVDEWRLYDESVVAIPEPARVGAMTWAPSRQPWRSTQADLSL